MSCPPKVSGGDRWGPRQQPAQDLRQLPLHELQLGDLLAHSVQVLRHEVRQAGAHGETLPIVEFGQCGDAGQ